MEYEGEDSTALFMVMTVVVLLEAVQGTQALAGDTEGPPEHLFADTNNDPSVTLDVLQPLSYCSLPISSTA